jgi:lantibiotic modifying enzyme
MLFIPGIQDLLFLLIKLYAITKEEKYKEYGLLILKNSKSHFDFINRPLIELISGVSGILLALLHTANSGIEEEWLYEDITFYIELILESANISKEGIFWDVTQKNIQGLTGFSHGASGIGFVFSKFINLQILRLLRKLLI